MLVGGSEDPFFFGNTKTQPSVMSTRKRSTTEATNKLTKENNEARKLILRNVANELFSLMQGTREWFQVYVEHLSTRL